MKWVACFAIFAWIASTPSQEYKGTGELFNQIDKAREKKAVGASQEAAEFAKKSRSMPPGQAAAEWLKLLDSASKPLTRETMGTYNGMAVYQTFGVLPPPASWPDIEKLARTRASSKPTRNNYLALLTGAVLQNDTPVQWQSLEALLKQGTASGGGSDSSSILALYSKLAVVNRDAAHLERVLRLQIRATPGNATVELSDLVGVMGAEKATPLLRDLILNASVTVDASTGEKTTALARRIAMQNLAKLKYAEWGLTLSPDAIDLYEALDKRFPGKPAAKSPEQGYRTDPRETARIYYILGLIVHGRSDQAAAVVIKYKGQPLTGATGGMLSYELRSKGYAAQLYKFLSRVLAKHPELPLWREYIEVSTDTGNGASLIATLKTGLAQPKLSAGDKAAIESRLVDAEIAAGQIEEGVALMRRLMKSKPLPNGEGGYSHGDNGLKLAKIGYLLKRNDWLDEGLAMAQGGSDDYSFMGNREELAEFLFTIGRGPEAEKHLFEEIVLMHQPGANRFGGGGMPTALIELASIYQRAGRNEDVIKLIDGSTDWGAGDLAKLYTVPDSTGRPFGFVVAASLAALGHKEEAARIAEAVIRVQPNFDPAYGLFLDIRGNDAIPVFQGLYALDQFEERPLIWISEALRRDGKLDEAEKYARKAIEVDPSDGDEHLGTRLLAYSTLATIRAAKGANDEAAQLNTAVKAIRLAEQADLFNEAGMQSTAIKMYKQSLDMFQDAYCIQSRLAVDLSEAGRFDEAAEHYRRAYELMPNSFGRVETHCLGCEHVFDGELAQSVAEKVFGDLLEKTPKKPQVHYLMGYLREDQGKFAEAAQNYRRAVELDPDYLNAWVHLASMADHGVLTAAEAEKAQLELNKLDPQQKHAERMSSDVRDLKALWNATDLSLKTVPAPPESLYPLAASKVAIEQRQSTPGDVGQMGMGSDDLEGMNPFTMAVRTASQAVARTSIMMAIEQLFQSTERMGFTG